MTNACNFLAEEYKHKSCCKNDGEIDYSRQIHQHSMSAFFLYKSLYFSYILALNELSYEIDEIDYRSTQIMARAA